MSKQNDPTNDLIKVFIEQYEFSGWVNVHQLTEEFNKINNPITVNPHKMGRQLIKLGLYKSYKKNEPHYIKAK